MTTNVWYTLKRQIPLKLQITKNFKALEKS